MYTHYILVYVRITQIYYSRFSVCGCREIDIVWIHIIKYYQIRDMPVLVMAVYLQHTSSSAVGCVLRNYKSINMNYEYIKQSMKCINVFFFNLLGTNVCILVINVISRVLMEKIKENWLYFRFALKRFMKLFIIIIICIFTNGFF